MNESKSKFEGEDEGVDVEDKEEGPRMVDGNEHGFGIAMGNSVSSNNHEHGLNGVGIRFAKAPYHHEEEEGAKSKASPHLGYYIQNADA